MNSGNSGLISSSDTNVGSDPQSVVDDDVPAILGE